MDYLQNDFSNGLDLLSADARVAPNGYVWLINARSRFGRLDPIKKHLLIDIPVGKLQGGVTLGNILIVFVSGFAYYQKDGDIGWIQIPGFRMSATENEYWTCAVPFSTSNFRRSLDVSKNIHAPIVERNDFRISGTPAAIVVQDSVTQPYLIMYDTENQIFTSRACKTYNEWKNVSVSADDREYVPIGRQMMLFNGNILFIVSKDKKSILRSITGRPLDFMVNVDENGNKMSSETLGGAQTVSFNFDYDDITCIENIDIPDAFIYGTPRNTRIIVADYNNTVFGEPQFRVLARNTSGIINQYSFAQSLNDWVQIGANGISSFNAVQQLKFKGNNSIFTLQLQKLLTNSKTGAPIKQVDCSIINFANYLLCNLDTYWGNIICVYDTLRDTWAALDITRVVRVKRFLIVDTASEDKLYAITKAGKLYRMFAGPTTETAGLRVKGYTPQATDTEHKSQKFVAFFDKGTFNGKAVLRELVDDQQNHPRKSVEASITALDLAAEPVGINYPVRPPVIPSNKQQVQVKTWPLAKGLEGKKISFQLMWTNDSSVLEYQFTDSEDKSDSSQRQKQDTYANGNSNA